MRPNWLIVVGGAAGILIGLACGLGESPPSAEVVALEPAEAGAASGASGGAPDDGDLEPALVTMERKDYGEAVPTGLGLCDPGESTWFTCPVEGSGKVVSLCGEPSALRYRFGRPGAVELELERAGTRGARLGGRTDVAGVQYLITRGGMTKLATVDVGTEAATYVLQDRFEGSAALAGEPSGFLGLSVRTAAGESVELPCRPGEENHHLRQLHAALPD